MLKKKVVYLLAVFIVCMGVSCFVGIPPVGAHPIELTFASFSSSTSATGQVCNTFLDGIEKRTSNRVRFKRLWGGTLLKGSNLYQGIVDGIADVGMCVFGYTPGRFPLWQAMDLPVGFDSAKQANRVQWEVYKEFKPKELASTKVLFLFTCSPADIWSRVPIRKLEDLRGLRIRATGFCAKMVKALGGTPVAAPVPEVYEMLAKGIVDGTWSSIDVLKSFKQDEVTKYVTLNGLYVSSFYVVMNRNTWNSLPKDIQKIIDDYCEQYVETAGVLWDKRSAASLQYARNKGLEIISLPDAELARWRERVKPLLGEYVASMKRKGLPGAEFLHEIERLRAKYSNY